MEPQVKDDQMLVGGFFFIFVAFLASAAVIDYSRDYGRGKEKMSPLLNSLGSNIDIDAASLEDDDFPQASFDEPEDLYAYNRSRLLAIQAREPALTSRQWA